MKENSIEDVIEVIDEELDDKINELLFDIITHFDFQPMGIFPSPEYIAEKLYAYVLNCLRTDYSGKSWLEYAEQRLEERKMDCEADCDVATIIEKAAQTFREKAKWQFAIIGQKPIMWFGIEGRPVSEGWVLNYDDSTWSEFWQEKDLWERWESLITTPSETFLIWMTAEKGCDCPNDFDEVLDECPIQPHLDWSVLELKAAILDYERQIRLTGEFRLPEYTVLLSTNYECTEGLYECKSFDNLRKAISFFIRTSLDPEGLDFSDLDAQVDEWMKDPDWENDIYCGGFYGGSVAFRCWGEDYLRAERERDPVTKIITLEPIEFADEIPEEFKSVYKEILHDEGYKLQRDEEV